MDILRYVAFSANPSGGNPAGVVLEAADLSEGEMARIAADVGFSETAFVSARPEGGFDVRYFSPQTEVPFCGHATIATAVAYAERRGVGDLLFHTKAGTVRVGTSAGPDGTLTAELTTVAPETVALEDEDLDALLASLRWSRDDLDPALPPRVAYAGAWHPVIAARSRTRLADLDYDMVGLRTLMLRHDWATIDLVWRESERVFHARNPFPPGGVVEDPATGAAAGALGGYLRELGLVRPPFELTVHQGTDMGRPSVISVSIPEGLGTGIRVRGTARAI